MSSALHREVELPPYRLWETRAGSGTPVVLIHGLAGSSEWWRRNFDVLAASHEVAAVDLVGFGRTQRFFSRGTLPLSFVDTAALLARWIESTFREPVHLVGNSMGGHTAIYLAAARPELVRSLVLVDATGIPFEIRPGLHLENLVVPPGALSFAQVLARDLVRGGPSAIAIALARLLRDDARPQLRAIRVPTLLLWGEHDPLVPLVYGERMAAEIEGARLIVIRNAGHVPMWEQPETFNRELLRFIDSIDETPATRSRSRPAFSWGVSGWNDGIAHREAGHRRDVVLVHGLGVSSAYYKPLAERLYAAGSSPIAPDLPGFGESADGPPASAEVHAQILAGWAERLKISNAIWIGQSLGCQPVAHLLRARPDLARAAVYLSPLWTAHRRPLLRLFFRLLADIPREPLALFPVVLAAYWRSGLRRALRTARDHVRDMSAAHQLRENEQIAAGQRDPLMDREHLMSLAPQAALELPGAHAMHFSHPEAVAAWLGEHDALTQRR
jgi:pimeloyl-ACP methyl ester carboxylesterase